MPDSDPPWDARTDPLPPATRPIDAPRPSQLHRELGPGSQLGAYRIERFVGAGGMGEVYRAVDLRLHRPAAIKLVRIGIFGLEDAPRARDRLLREAQAMARVAHPNVVTVYEAGIAGDEVFIAMEYVAGATLRADLQTRRGWREILDRFRAAGRGLGAAHRAGLVHRDFKPDNVLVGEDGRVRVTDFGLAGASAGETLPSGPVPDSQPILTYSYAMAGTPAYMSPEQHAGEPIDARSDLFAFCVSLWEALYGELPFEGSTAIALRRGVLAGVLREPRATRGVPPWVRAILARGLARDPAARFPSMDALLDALGRDPAARRRRLGIGLGLAGLVALALFGLLRRTPSPESACGGAAAGLAGRWDDEVRAALGEPRVAAALDRHAAAWTAMRRQACEATARREQSEALLDLRMECLDRRAAEIGALTKLLIGERPPVERALAAASRLSDLGDCADAAALTTIAAVPADRTRAAELRSRLDEARARLLIGQPGAGIALAAAVAGEARTLAHPQLAGEALYLLGALRVAAGDPPGAKTALEESLLHAARAKDDLTVARAWSMLVHTLGVEMDHFDEALALLPAANAAAARAGDAGRMHAGLLARAAAVQCRKGDAAAARESLEGALRLDKNAELELGEKGRSLISADCRREPGRSP